jgi:hypothetical protein
MELRITEEKKNVREKNKEKRNKEMFTDPQL